MPVIRDENGKYVQLTPEEYNQQISVMRRRLNLDAEGKWVGDVVPDLDVVKINGEEFTGIGYEGLLSVNTKTYVTEPTRAGDGAIKNINDYETFYVPRVKINFKYFSIRSKENLGINKALAKYKTSGSSFIFISIPFALLKAQNVMKKRWLVAAFFL